jgi:hypothetical protein
MHKVIMRFEGFAAVRMMMLLLYVLAPCRMVDISTDQSTRRQNPEEHHQASTLHTDPHVDMAAAS